MMQGFQADARGPGEIELLPLPGIKNQIPDFVTQKSKYIELETR